VGGGGGMIECEGVRFEWDGTRLSTAFL